MATYGSFSHRGLETVDMRHIACFGAIGLRSLSQTLMLTPSGSGTLDLTARSHSDTRRRSQPADATPAPPSSSGTQHLRKSEQSTATTLGSRISRLRHRSRL